MRVRYSRRFEKRFRRLSCADKQAVIETIEVFLDNPLMSSLANHPLRGRMTGQRSLSVDNDLRIIFSVKGDYEEVLLIDIGSHAEVYRD